MIRVSGRLDEMKLAAKGANGSGRFKIYHWQSRKELMKGFGEQKGEQHSVDHSAEIEKFRMVVNAAPNGILIVDNKGEIVLINSNAEQMFAYERGELDGQAMSILIPKRYDHEHQKHQKGYFAQPEARPMGEGRELFAVRKDGSEFPVEIGLQPITSDKGIAMTMAVVVDISQRRRLQDERQQMEERVLEINENEQRRLGREIHDDLCQQLAAIGCLARVVEQDLRKSGLPAADSIGEIVSLVSNANVRAREISRGSAAAVLDADGLTYALEDLARLTGKATGKKCAFESEEGVSTGSLSVDLQLYRIAQEAVNNAVRHGEPDEIYLRLCEEDGQILLTVTDDGCGILEESLQDMDGMGLQTMSYRAEASGGVLQVRRRKSSGTEVRCVVPVISES